MRVSSVSTRDSSLAGSEWHPGANVIKLFLSLDAIPLREFSSVGKNL
jgi:hypothetical protein